MTQLNREVKERKWIDLSSQSLLLCLVLPYWLVKIPKVMIKYRESRHKVTAIFIISFFEVGIWRLQVLFFFFIICLFFICLALRYPTKATFNSITNGTLNLFTSRRLLVWPNLSRQDPNDPGVLRDNRPVNKRDDRLPPLEPLQCRPKHGHHRYRHALALQCVEDLQVPWL